MQIYVLVFTYTQSRLYTCICKSMHTYVPPCGSLRQILPHAKVPNIHVLTEIHACIHTFAKACIHICSAMKNMYTYVPPCRSLQQIFGTQECPILGGLRLAILAPSYLLIVRLHMSHCDMYVCICVCVLLHRYMCHYDMYVRF
jgi:hypothetical protein